MKVTGLDEFMLSPLGEKLVYENRRIEDEDGVVRNVPVFFTPRLALAIIAMFQGKNPENPDAPELTMDDKRITFGLTQKMVLSHEAHETSIDLSAEEVVYCRRMSWHCLHHVVAGYINDALQKAETNVVEEPEAGIQTGG